MDHESDDRTERIRNLSRLNRRRLKVPQLLSDLSRVLDEPIAIAALCRVEDADIFHETFRRGYLSSIGPGGIGYRKLFPPTGEHSVYRLARCLASRIAGEDAIFLTKSDGDQEAIKLKADSLLEHAWEIIDIDGDSVTIISADYREGLMIDYNPDDPLVRFEFAVWGDRWPLLILACDHQ